MFYHRTFNRRFLEYLALRAVDHRFDPEFSRLFQLFCHYEIAVYRIQV